MTQTPGDRAAAMERIVHTVLPVLADPDSPADAVKRARAAWGKLTGLIDGLHGITTATAAGTPPETTVKPKQAQPHVARVRAREDIRDLVARLERAAEREAAGYHKLRKGRRQCEAETRNGGRCQAPAIPGGDVCRRHGGGAPQVRVQAALMVLYEARHEAHQAFTAARGGPGESDALCEFTKADNAVKRAEDKVQRIRELRAELRRRKAS